MLRRQVLKIWLLVMWGASSSFGCASGEPRLKEEVDGEIVLAPRASPLDEFGISNGQRDVDNHYRSVVLVESALGRCSGVLIAQRLVLTAAHCFCAPGSVDARAIDSTNCVRSAKVTSVFYKQGQSQRRPVMDSANGTVAVNGEFRSEVEHRGGRMFVRSRVADLAVVRLGKTLENTVPDGRLRSEEVLVHDEVVVAGFGATGPGAPTEGERRVGRNKVAMIRAANAESAREIRFLFPGAHTHRGDSGGPCFREEGGVRWLVGINGGFVNVEGSPESWFTSTSSYREWIEEQLAAARKLDAP